MFKCDYCGAGGGGEDLSRSDVSTLRLSVTSGPAARPRPSICEDKPNWASPPSACDQ